MGRRMGSCQGVAGRVRGAGQAHRKLDDAGAGTVALRDRPPSQAAFVGPPRLTAEGEHARTVAPEGGLRAPARQRLPHATDAPPVAWSTLVRWGVAEGGGGKC